MSVAGMRAGIELRKKVVKHIIKLDLSYLHKSSVGRLLNHINVESAAVLNIATTTLTVAFKNAVTCLIMFSIMAYYGRYMFFVLLFLVPTIGLSIRVIVRKMRKITKKVFDTQNMHASILLQVMNGLKTVKSYVREKYEVNRIFKFEQDLYKHSLKQAKISSAQTPIVETFVGIGLAMSLWGGGQLIAEGLMTTGDFVAFLLAMTAAYKPLKGILNINTNLQKGLIGAERIYKFLDEKPLITNKLNSKKSMAKKANIEFENVSFAYDKKDGSVINDLSLKLNNGKVCAFVGPSGSGKTTIMNLITRFYDIDSGSIKINGIDIRDYNLDTLRENVAFVHQDSFLFDGTVADNIRYGNLKATKKQIEEAAKLAACYDFITKELPNSFDTVIGENGSSLSGGQKQRISIARALLKDSPILLLDEATSALDTESEKLIQNAINKLIKGRTTFVIAHRLSTILDADVICVINKGKIVEQGSHEELIKNKNGLYKKLYDIQFKSESK